MTLRERLLERIAAEGPLTFADFVSAALYDETEGFYSGAPVGVDGHFATSPHVSPVYGHLIARLAELAWDAAGKPDGFTIADAGAGDGTLLRVIRGCLSDALARCARFLAVERMPRARALAEAAGLATVGGLERVASGSVGFLIANELFDNLPFHRLRRDEAGAWHEVRVSARDGELFEVLSEPDQALLGCVSEMDGAHERTVSPSADDLVREIARVVAGYTLIVDYDDEKAWLPIRAYRNGRIELDLLDEPGSRDITAGVDFDRIAAVAGAAGLRIEARLTQRDLLKALGCGDVTRDLRRQQHALERDGRWREALRFFGARQAASVLTDEHQLGGFSTLVLASGGFRSLALTAAGASSPSMFRRA